MAPEKGRPESWDLRPSAIGFSTSSPTDLTLVALARLACGLAAEIHSPS
jgi:hypothetical protein